MAVEPEEVRRVALDELVDEAVELGDVAAPAVAVRADVVGRELAAVDVERRHRVGPDVVGVVRPPLRRADVRADLEAARPQRRRELAEDVAAELGRHDVVRRHRGRPVGEAVAVDRRVDDVLEARGRGRVRDGRRVPVGRVPRLREIRVGPPVRAELLRRRDVPRHVPRPGHAAGQRRADEGPPDVRAPLRDRPVVHDTCRSRRFGRTRGRRPSRGSRPSPRRS